MEDFKKQFKEQFPNRNIEDLHGADSAADLPAIVRVVNASKGPAVLHSESLGKEGIPIIRQFSKPDPPKDPTQNPVDITNSRLCPSKLLLPFIFKMFSVPRMISYDNVVINISIDGYGIQVINTINCV